MRQLENICHWLTVMAPAQLIEPKDLPPEVARRRAGGGARAAPAAQPAACTRPAAPDDASPAPAAAAGAGGRSPPVSAAGKPGLEAEALELLASGRHDVWEELTQALRIAS